MENWEKELSESIEQKLKKELYEKQVLGEFFSNVKAAFEDLKSKFIPPYSAFIADGIESSRKIGIIVFGYPDYRVDEKL